jgi:molybdate transport system substrate-binding protein
VSINADGRQPRRVGGGSREPGARPGRRLIGLLFAALLGGGLARPAAAAELLVFAAASLSDAMSEIAVLFESEDGARVVCSFGASSALARQIEHGAPAAIYISANRDWVDYLEARGLVEPGSRGEIAGNRLALIAPAGSPAAAAVGADLPLAALLGDGRLALGDPDHVPAGRYAKAALTHLGLWQAVAGRLARLANVRAALAFVERGETPLGVVYESDAAASARVKLVGLFPDDSHPPVVYTAALVAGRADPLARRFLAFLRGPQARAVLARHRFRTE